jgi:hypothetical protein
LRPEVILNHSLGGEIMNAHLLDHIATDSLSGVMRSVLFFIKIFIIITVIGLAFFAAM